jgi:hypothetical protein
MIGTTASAEIALRPCACRRALLLAARAHAIARLWRRFAYPFATLALYGCLIIYDALMMRRARH